MHGRYSKDQENPKSYYPYQGVSWKELAIFDGFCLVALSYFGGGELAFVSYFTWLARLASLFGRY